MKRLAQLIVLLTSAIILTSCKSTPEPNFTNLPGDFKFTKLQSDLFSVTYTGEAYVTEVQAKKFAGQRVASLCLNEDFNYFIVLDRSSGWVQRQGQLGYAPEHSAAQPHQVPQIKASVRFFKKKPNIETQAVYNAEEIEENLSVF